MSGEDKRESAGSAVELEMTNLIDSAAEYKPSAKELKQDETKETFEERFNDILNEWYDDRKNWWDSVEAFLKEDAEFRTKVEAKLQEQAGESVPRKQVIISVLADMLLLIEDISMDKALVYVLDEGFSNYPMEYLALELLKRGADPNKEKGYSGDTPLHLAIEEGNEELVKVMLKKGANLDVQDDYGYTPVLEAVNYSHVGILKLLLDKGGDVMAVTSEKKTALHFAAQNGDEEIMEMLVEKGASLSAEDKDGWTPLHEASYYGDTEAIEFLVSKNVSVNARDNKKRTPLHVAAEEGEEEACRALLEAKADSSVQDYEGNTPLDLAAKEQYEECFDILVEKAYSSKKDDNCKKDLKKFIGLANVDHIKPEKAAEKITEMSPFGVAKMLQYGGEDKICFIKHFAAKKKLRKATKAITDQLVLGKRRVNCEIIEADHEGRPPDHDEFDHTSRSVFEIIADQNNKELATHPAIKTLLDYKWKKYARWIFLLSFLGYSLRMLVFGLAILIAARPDLDNPGCYNRSGWDIVRGILEGISMLFFLYKAYDEVSEIIAYKRDYFKDYYNYLQISSFVLPFLIIPFRAATTWCASTGVGYCALPQNGSIDINLHCIRASSIQWIFASLAYLANAALIIEYLSLFRVTGVYVRILLKIIASDIIKFTVVFLVVVYIFLGSFYLALRAGVSVNSATGELTSDLNVFAAETLYPWHILFTGIRILVESGGIIEGYYTEDENGVIVGYQWFSIVLYLTFLFMVIIVLLNLLIAQMSDTYTKVQEDVEGTFAVARARIIARLQKGKFLGCGQPFRKKFYVKSLWTEPTEQELKEEEVEIKNQVENLEEKVDHLTRLMEELLVAVKGEKKEEDTPPEPIEDDVINVDSDISFIWSDDDDKVDGDDDDKVDGDDDDKVDGDDDDKVDGDDGDGDDDDD